MAVKSPREIWRDYVTDGVPSTGNHNPIKGDIRAWAESLQAQVSYVYDDLAALNANLVPVAGSRAEIRGDSDSPSNDGIYQKVGGTGTGSWTKIDDLPDVVADNDITNAKLANMAEARIKGRVTSGSGDPEDLTAAQVRTIINVEDGAEVNVVDSVAGKTGAVSLVKADVGLGSVENTADADKPVSTATQTALDAKAAIADVSQRQGRPGDAAPRFVSTLTGAGSAASAPSGSTTNNTDGAVLRVTGAAVVGTRERIATEPGRSYRVRWVIRRQTDPTDPAGDTVRCGIQWLTNAKADNGTLIDGSLDTVLTVADGRTVITTVVADDDPVPDSPPNSPPDSVNYEWPAGTRYMVPFVQTFGLDGVTDVELIEWVDITDLANVQIDISAEVEAELSTKQDLDSLLTSLSGNVTVPIALGGHAATTAVGGIDNLSTVGADIPAATTTEIGGSTGRKVTVTGSGVSITGFGTTGAVGIFREIRFTGANTLVHGAVLNLPGGVDIVTAFGDYFIFTKTGASTWHCVSYSPYRENKAPISSSAGVPNALTPMMTDSSGRLSYTMRPTFQQLLQDEGPIGWTGDGLRTQWNLRPDGEINNVDFDKAWDRAARVALPRRVLIFGDSRGDQCSNPYGAGTVIVTKGWLFWLLTRLRGRLSFWDNSQNYAVAGSLSEELLDQVDDALDAETERCVAFIITSTNDRTQNIRGRISIGNIQSAVDLLTKEKGFIVVPFAEQPRGDSESDDYRLDDPGQADDLGWHMVVRQAILDMGDATSVLPADPWIYQADIAFTDGRALDGMFYDSLHNAPPGAYWMAQSAFDVLDPILPPRPILPITNNVYDQYFVNGSLVANPLLAGSVAAGVAGITGVKPTDWSVAIGAGLAATTSKVLVSGEPDWYQVVLSGAPTGTFTAAVPDVTPLDATAVSFRLYQSISPSNVVSGDVLEAVLEIEVDAGASQFRGVPLYVHVTVDGVTTTVCTGEPDMGTTPRNLDLPDVAWDGILVTPRMTVPIGTVEDVTAEWLMTGRSNAGGGPHAVSATARVRRFAVKKVLTNG